MSVTRLVKNLDPINWIFSIVAITLAAIEGWQLRYYVNMDGIAYMDIGDAVFSGNWQAIFNGCWNPIYGLLLGLAMAILSPGFEQEFLVVNLVNFICFLLSLICFQFFINNLIAYQNLRSAREGELFISPLILKILGYCLFIWSSLHFISILSSTPDMLLSAIIYLIAGLLISISRQILLNEKIAIKKSILLGFLLGFGYLVKSIFFPLSIIFIAGYAVAIRTATRRAGHVTSVIVIFLIICLPYVWFLSKATNKITFGESGRLTYLFVVDSVPFTNWQGDDQHSRLIHPTRRISTDPEIYEFATPIIATYPPWYDPYYWLAGAKIKYSWQNHKRILFRHLKFYGYIFINIFGSLSLTVLLLALYNHRLSFVSDLLKNYLLLLPPLVVFVLYGLIHIETRYIGPFLLLFWLGIFSGIKIGSVRPVNRLISLMLIISMILITAIVARKEYLICRDLKQIQRDPVIIAQGLKRLGVKPGDKVAIINLTFYASLWARLGHLKIVAQVPEDLVSKADRSKNTEIINTFISTGANYLVADGIPQWSNPDNWIKIENTDLYLYRLN